MIVADERGRKGRRPSKRAEKGPELARWRRGGQQKPPGALRSVAARTLGDPATGSVPQAASTHVPAPTEQGAPGNVRVLEPPQDRAGPARVLGNRGAKPISLRALSPTMRFPKSFASPVNTSGATPASFAACAKSSSRRTGVPSTMW